MSKDAPRSSRQPRPSRGGGGGFWLGLSVIVGGIAAVYIFAPEIPRQMFGGPGRPDAGDEPVTAQASATTLTSRDQTATNALTQPSKVARTATAAAPKTTTGATTPTAAPDAKSYGDETKAQAYLLKAEEAYKIAPSLKDWSRASSEARKIIGLSAKPATMVRAKDIIHGCEAMAKVFKDLEDKDELQRNFDTDPQLLVIGTGSSTSKAVPIVSMDTQEVVKGDPLEWIANQRKTGKVTLLILGKKEFMAGTLPADQVTSVERANVAEVITGKRKMFDERLARLKNGALAENALAWYDAAKFAYQNRLDDQIATMMDRALYLDPLLAQSVREDKAGGLFANIVLHLNNNNRKAADAFMGIIARRFSDTPSGLQARAFYDTKTKVNADEVAKAKQALRDASRAAQEREAEEARQRKEQRVNRAKETGDEKEIAAAEKAPVNDHSNEPEETPESSGPAATGDEGKADELYAKGAEIYSKAIDAGNSSARDDLYAQANKFLTEANNIYNRLSEKDPDNAALSDKNFMCNKLRYGSIKQRRFH